MKKTLWLLSLAGQATDRLFLFYAVDEAEANERATNLEKDHGATRRDLRQFAKGFRVVEVELPGQIEVEETE